MKNDQNLEEKISGLYLRLLGYKARQVLQWDESRQFIIDSLEERLEFLEEKSRKEFLKGYK